MQKISVILPTYNEKDNIIVLIDRIKKQLIGKIDYEIIVVDDNSPDGTWKLVENYQMTDKKVKLIHRTSERGLTSAFNAGISSAIGDVVAWMDCDLSHPPELLGSLIENLKTHDAVVASRFIEGGKDVRDGAYKFQQFLSIVLSKLSYLITRNTVRDITSGYIAIKKEYLDKVTPLCGDYGEYFIDLLCRLNRVGCRIKEIPYVFGNREFGESKTSTNFFGYFPRGLKYLRMLARHYHGSVS